MLKATATIRTDAEGIHIDVIWSGVDLDRPHVGGWLLGSKQMKLAQRLKRAVDAQVVHVNRTVLKDIFGKTYVASRCLVHRTINADLIRLGY